MNMDMNNVMNEDICDSEEGEGKERYTVNP